jgi:hypothetical protein
MDKKQAENWMSIDFYLKELEKDIKKMLSQLEEAKKGKFISFQRLRLLTIGFQKLTLQFRKYSCHAKQEIYDLKKKWKKES